MPHRQRHDVAFAAIPHLLEPLRDLLDQRELAELGDYFYQVQMATLEALERELENERRRMYPLGHSEN